jgi:hypothetical protein
MEGFDETENRNQQIENPGNVGLSWSGECRLSTKLSKKGNFSWRLPSRKE